MRTIANEMGRQATPRRRPIRVIKPCDHYTKVRDEIKQASGDYIDLKAYEPGMRQLIDMYISADASKKISAFDDLSLGGPDGGRAARKRLDKLPDGIRKNKSATAETIENNVRRVIIEERPTNPKYFDSMAALLEQLILERRKQHLEYASYLRRMMELAKQVKQPEASTSYPQTHDTRAKRALYDNLNGDAELSLALDHTVRTIKKDNWRGHPMKEREVRNAITKVLPSTCDVDAIFELIKSQHEY
jgi:type I restriction enzyme R subunit